MSGRGELYPVSHSSSGARVVLLWLALWLVAAASRASGVDVASLLAKARAEGTVNVIVRLAIAARPEGSIQTMQVQTQRSAIARAQDDVLARLSPFDVASVKRYETIPFVAMQVDAVALERLCADSSVIAVEEDERLHTMLDRSGPLIGAPAAWAAGYTGAGQVVAILDTGVDKTHPFLSGKVVSEACYSSKSLLLGSTCPGSATQSTDAGSGVPCTFSGCEHGTHVAGIVAGKSASFSGVAPDAGIIAIQVTSRDLLCFTSNCTAINSSDVLLGMQRVQQLAGSYKIAAVNLSLGGRGSGSPCDSTSSAWKAAIDNLRSLGIATIVASGNEGNPGGISTPACVSTAISVGSTGDGGSSTKVDAVSAFSNSASFLTLLAPGDSINSSIPGGTFRSLSGTSAAAPQVAGAWAVLKSKTPSATVPQLLQALAGSGKSVLDSRNQITKSRIQVDSAVAALPSGACAYAIAPASQSVAVGGGTGTVAVTADAGCAWTARSDVAWITVSSGATGTGNGSVGFSVLPNASIERAGTVSIAGQLFVITQAGVPLLSVDDGVFEGFRGIATTGTSSTAVNRLTPSTYPVTIDAVAIYFPSGTDLEVGDPLTILAGTNPGGGSTIDNTQFVTTAATVRALDQFNVYPIKGLAVSAGDFIVGVSTSGYLAVAIDTTSQQRRSYFSSDGRTFKLLDDLGTKGNYAIRAIPSQTLSCLTIAGVTPTSSRSGSGDTFTITGTQLNEATGVAFSYNVAASYTGGTTQITAALPDTAESGPIAVSSKPACAAALTPLITIAPCVTVSPSAQAFGNIAGTGTFSVATSGSCRWNARSNASWLTISSGATGTGNGSVSVGVAANTGYAGRQGTLTIGGVTVTVRQAASGGNCATSAIVPGQVVSGSLSWGDCPATLTALHVGKTFSFSGATGQKVDISLRTASSAFDPLLGLFGPAGNVITTNAGAAGKTDARIQATLDAGGKYSIEVTSTSGSSTSTGNFTLTFASTTPGCSYSVSPASVAPPVEGGTGTISVTTTGNCSWEAGTDASWISINSGRTGTGSGTVTYSVPANPGPARSAVIGIAGTSVTFVQVSAFCATGSPAVYHNRLASAALPNGKVLIAGGINSGVANGSAELYDPSTGTFSVTGNLIAGREQPTATLLANGKVLLAGGRGTGTSNTLASAEVYDPSVGAFDVTGAMAQNRRDHSATLLKNGKVLVAGGSNISSFAIASAELYDPTSGTFAATGSMAIARSQHEATLLADGRVLVTGGSSSSSAAEIYDPATGQFSSAGSLTTTRNEHTATLLSNGKVLVAGGSSGPLASAEIFDPAIRTFSPTGNLDTGRYAHTATLLPDGKVLIVAGYAKVSTGGTSISGLAELYDPATGSFAVAGGLSAARANHTATLLQNGRVLIVGGSAGGAELYCPLDNGRRRAVRH